MPSYEQNHSTWVEGIHIDLCEFIIASNHKHLQNLVTKLKLFITFSPHWYGLTIVNVVGHIID